MYTYLIYYDFLQEPQCLIVLDLMLDMSFSVTSAACITAVPLYYTIVSFSHAFSVSLFNEEKKRTNRVRFPPLMTTPLHHFD